MNVLIVVLLLSFVFFIVWFLQKFLKNREFYRNIPNPPIVPLFGNIFEIRSTKDILNFLLKNSKEFNGLYKLYKGPFHKSLIASDYKFVEFILSSTKILNKADEYSYLHPWLGTGLLTSDGPKWKKRRKILTPAFHFQILTQFIEVFEASGDRLIRKLYNKVGKSSVNIYPLVTLCTLDIICESAMGTFVNAQFDENSNYVKSVKTMCKIVMERIFNVLQISDLTFSLTKNYYRQKKALKFLHDQTNSVIRRKRKQLELETVKLNEENRKSHFCDIEETSEKDDSENKLIIRRKNAFLDLLLQAKIDGKPLAQDEIREEVDTFMFEGHDTTASAISFALYCLANYADAQKKAYEEQIFLFGNNKKPAITYSDLQSMKYLELVIKETLRLYPSVPFYARKTNQKVEFNGITIPKGVTINIFAFGIHRNPNYFEDPERFNPSRFEKIDGKLPYAYIPFSAGPRNCIGQKFAMLEMKSTISNILRHFELHPASPQQEPCLVAETVLKSANGVNISITLRP